MASKKRTTRKKATSKKKVTKKKVIAKKAAKKTATKKKATPSRSKATSDEDPRIERLKTLLKLMDKSNLGELSYEDSDIRVSLKQAGAVAAVSTVAAAPVAAAPAAVAATSEAVSTASATVEESDDTHVICSPFVGTFYIAPSPDSDSFTGVGQAVSEGQTVCIIEAMKLMNEIEAEVGGVVTEVLVENGQGVQYGEPLFKVKVS